MSDASRLQAAAERQSRLMDAALGTFSAELRSALTRVDASIRRLIRGLDTTDRQRLTMTRENLRAAVRARDTILQALEQAGVADVVQRAMSSPFRQLAEDILLESRRDGVTFDVSALKALERVRLTQVLGVTDDTAVVLWRAVLDGVVGSRPVSKLVSDVARATDRTLSQARTLYDTAISTYGRQVEALASDGTPEEVFIYLGPVDQKMRDFCRERVGKVYTRTDIDAMDNGSLPNVFITGGGYNCRHVWKRVSAFDQELLDLAGTGQRAPEFRALMKASAAA